MIGVAWVSDEEFRMNKAVLARVMGIKLNTLNVNLRDLRFTQLQRHKEGWTRWKKSGFTRQSSGVGPDVENMGMAISPKRMPIGDPHYLGKSMNMPFALGRLSPHQNQMFLTQAQQLWTDLVGVSHTTQVPTDTLVDKAARMFRHTEQPLENAKEVIRAIITPTVYEAKLSFVHFARFLAMFGPTQTIMLKIASLLTCSNNTGKWLTFDSDPTSMHQLPYAFFDPNEPNCLEIHPVSRHAERVFNNPTVDSNGKPYLYDEQGKMYYSWEEYFNQHPINSVGLYPL
jgi:hypothetical protein